MPRVARPSKLAGVQSQSQPRCETEKRITPRFDDSLRILGMLAGGAAIPEVLGALCEAMAEESDAGTRCAAALLDNGRLSVVAAPGLPATFVSGVHGRLLVPDQDSLGMAVFGHEPVVIEDVRRDARCRHFRSLALPHGVLSLWSIPIKSTSGAVVGALVSLSPTPRQPGQAELECGRRAAQTAGIVLEHHAAAEDMRRRNAELEERVRRHTAELEAVNRELESFTGAVAHDLRAPLRAIAGYGNLLLSDCADALGAEGKGYLRRIAVVGKRMADMIDALVHLSRLSRVELRRAEVDLSGMVASLAGELPSGDGRPVQFAIQPGAVANADPNLIRIALGSLLGNAWKFTRDVPEPRIEFGVVDGTEGRAYFVRDNGAGFDMRYAGRLFVPFERLHSGAEYEGGGAGLATVRRVIHRHGGRVWAEGRPGEGATFYFTL